MRIFTKSRPVQLFGAGGTPLTPAVRLPIGTELEVDVESTVDLQKSGVNWFVKAKVVRTGAEGYVPTAVLADYALADIKVPGRELLYTGVTYGGYATTWKDDKLEVWDTRCPDCGHDWDRHKLHETVGGPAFTDRFGHKPSQVQTHVGSSKDAPLYPPDAKNREYTEVSVYRGTRNDAEKLYNALRDYKAGRGVTNPFGTRGSTMIGVLHTDGMFQKPIAAHSGTEDYAIFGEVVQKLGWVWAKTLQADHRFVKGPKGQLVCDWLQTQKQYRVTCAAPKMIQGAYALGRVPYAMSEIQYEPRGEGKANEMPSFHTIESCDQCRRTVRPMLCPDR
jgi:hypothetical protein